MRIGEFLVNSKLIKQTELEVAIKYKQFIDSKIGEVLINLGFINNLDFYISLAKLLNLDFINLQNCTSSFTLLKDEDREDYLKYKFVPFEISDDEYLIIITSNLPKEIEVFVRQKYPDFKIKYMISTEKDILYSLQNKFSAIDIDYATNNLKKSYPFLSITKFINFVPLFIILLTVCLPLLAYLFEVHNEIFTCLGYLINFFYLLNISFRIFLFIFSAKKQTSILYAREDDIFSDFTNEMYSLDVNDYPKYSILIPLYKEEYEILTHLKQSIMNLKYPINKLDVKLVLESDDLNTINLCKKVRFPNYCKFILVPESLPRTKAKACNYALKYVEGEYVTIFDAEDRPDSLQLQKAAACFQQNPDVDCLQAELTYYNHMENILTKFFTLEYKSWFKYSLVALDYFRLPIPLGGSSNHIRAKSISKLKNWDPFNVTEDADLGVRISYFKMKTRVFNSVTEEEAPTKFNIWLKQRTRWIKGHLQTYIVYSFNSLNLIKKIGILPFISFQLFLGVQNICYLFGATIWLFFIIFVTDSYLNIFNFCFPKHLVVISVANFILSYIVHLFIAYYITVKNNYKNYKFACLTFPFYFFLHQLACILAFYELIFKPYHWNKTPHGASLLFKNGRNFE